MSGPHPSKKRLSCKVYLHHKDSSSNSRTMHIDIEGPIGKIIKPGETTFCRGKEGGIFIALKKNMINRVKILKK